MERGYIEVDALFRTSVPGISAIGDVITFERPATRSSRTCRRPKASSLAERIAGHESGRSTTTTCRGCTYCDPEIGSVGLTEAQAKERGYDVRVGTFPFGVLGRAQMAGETEGFVKIVAEKKYDEMLGVHMIGPRATELVAEATLALRLEVHGRGADPARSTRTRRCRKRWARRRTRRTARRFICRSELAVLHLTVRACRPQAARLSEVTMSTQRRDAPDGRVDRRRHHRPLDQEGRRRGRPRRAAVRDLHRQGGRRDSRRRRPACCTRSRSRKARRSRSTASSR